MLEEISLCCSEAATNHSRIARSRPRPRLDGTAGTAAVGQCHCHSGAVSDLWGAGWAGVAAGRRLLALLKLTLAGRLACSQGSLAVSSEMNRRLATKIEMKSASSDRGLPSPARRPAPPSWRHGLATAPPCVQAKFRALMAGQERGLGLRVPPKRRSDLAAFASLESGLELPERLDQTEYEGGARGGGDGGGDRPASGKQATKSRRFNVGGLQAASSVYGSAAGLRQATRGQGRRGEGAPDAGRARTGSKRGKRG